MNQRPPGTYENGPGILREIIKKDLGELSSTDREAIKHASAIFIRYSAFERGLFVLESSLSIHYRVPARTVLGSGLGILLALRGRYHPTRWSKLPKLFPNGIRNGPDHDAVRDRFGQTLKTIAFSAGGVLVGQSIGFVIGMRQSAKILHREGNYESIEKVMKKVQKDVMDNYQAGNVPGSAGSRNDGLLGDSGATRDAFGMPGPQSQASEAAILTDRQRRKLQGQRPPEQVNQSDFTNFYGDRNADSGENSRLNRHFERDTSQPPDSQPQGRAWGDSSFAKEMGNEPRISANETGFVGASDVPDPANPTQRRGQNNPPKRTRWEELRGVRDQKDSAWEQIRQTNARQQMNNASSPSGGNDLAADEFGLMSGGAQNREQDERRRRAEKERERLEYERMFEKESRGEDSL